MFRSLEHGNRLGIRQFNEPSANSGGGLIAVHNCSSLGSTRPKPDLPLPRTVTLKEDLRRNQSAYFGSIPCLASKTFHRNRQEMVETFLLASKF
jgi:hypothetical protein